MTKLSELKTHLSEFETKAHKPIKAAKGSDTWVKVQQAADKVSAAVTSPIHYIEQMRDSKDPADRKKIPGYIKTLRTQLNAVDLASVNKYIKEHGTGGDKKRGLLSTAKAKEDEKKRVAAAGELIRLVGLMQIETNRMDENDV